MEDTRPKPVTLTDRQRAELERIARRATAPQREVTRTKIILAAAEGDSNIQIARALGIDREQVRVWRGRWVAAEEGLIAAEASAEPKALAETIWNLLADQPRSGGPPTFTAEQLCAIMAVACEPPEKSNRPVTHWTPRELAAEVIQRGIVPTISPRHVGRFLNRRPTAAPSQPLLAQQ